MGGLPINQRQSRGERPSAIPAWRMPIVPGAAIRNAHARNEPLLPIHQQRRQQQLRAPPVRLPPVALARAAPACKAPFR